MSDGYPGWQGAYDSSNPYNAIAFFVRQMMAKASHIALVTVQAVHAQSDPLQPPTVDVQPMVAMVDQTGTATQHGTIYGVPTFRIQGGVNALICDPQQGDIGIMVCADRDISSAISNQAPSNPGSFRRFDWADGLYLGGVARVTPKNYVQLKDDGTINIVTDDNDVTVNVGTGTVTMTGATLNLNFDTINVADHTGSGDSDVELTGDLTASDDVVANGTSLHTHKHGGVTTGSGDTGTPV